MFFVIVFFCLIYTAGCTSASRDVIQSFEQSIDNADLDQTEENYILFGDTLTDGDKTNLLARAQSKINEVEKNNYLSSATKLTGSVLLTIICCAMAITGVKSLTIHTFPHKEDVEIIKYIIAGSGIIGTGMGIEVVDIAFFSHEQNVFNFLKKSFKANKNNQFLASNMFPY